MIFIDVTFDLGDLGTHRGFALGDAERTEHGHTRAWIRKACVYMPAGNLDVTALIEPVCAGYIEEKIAEKFNSGDEVSA